MLANIKNALLSEDQIQASRMPARNLRCMKEQGDKQIEITVLSAIYSVWELKTARASNAVYKYSELRNMTV